MFKVMKDHWKLLCFFRQPVNYSDGQISCSKFLVMYGYKHSADRCRLEMLHCVENGKNGAVVRKWTAVSLCVLSEKLDRGNIEWLQSTCWREKARSQKNSKDEAMHLQRTCIPNSGKVLRVDSENISYQNLVKILSFSKCLQSVSL